MDQQIDLTCQKTFFSLSYQKKDGQVAAYNFFGCSIVHGILWCGHGKVLEKSWNFVAKNSWQPWARFLHDTAHFFLFMWTGSHLPWEEKVAECGVCMHWVCTSLYHCILCDPVCMECTIHGLWILSPTWLQFLVSFECHEKDLYTSSKETQLFPVHFPGSPRSLTLI